MLRFKDKIPLWISVLSSILIPIYFAIEFLFFFEGVEIHQILKMINIFYLFLTLQK